MGSFVSARTGVKAWGGSAAHCNWEDKGEWEQAQQEQEQEQG